MKQYLPFLILMLLLPVNVFAQTDSIKHSPVPTLSDRQYDAYTRGIDLNNEAYVAELNHFPLPDKVLRYKHELDLSPIQIGRLNEILKTLKMKKAEIGLSIIRNEQMLDSLFRTRRLNEGAIIFYGNRYGLYEGEYRTALLQACYGTGKLLTQRQVNKLEALQKHK